MMSREAAKMEPGFWANSLKADVDSLNRLKEGGMEAVPVQPSSRPMPSSRMRSGARAGALRLVGASGEITAR
jgi:hypothetical protein